MGHGLVIVVRQGRNDSGDEAQFYTPVDTVCIPRSVKLIFDNNDTQYSDLIVSAQFIFLLWIYKLN